MRILVAAVSFSSKMSGIQRHAINIVKCLLAHPDISEVHLAIAPWQQEIEYLASQRDTRLKIHVAAVKPNPLSRNLWHYDGLPVLADRVQPDCLHLSFPVPIAAGTLRCPVVLTLHDLYPYEIPSNFRFPHVVLNRLVLQQALRRADAIACVSDATLARLEHYVSERVSAKAARIYNCVEPKSCDATSNELPELQGTFLLCVAQHRRNKNIGLLIRVFKTLVDAERMPGNTKLLVVGISGPETKRLHTLVAQMRLAEHVIFTDGLTDSALQWCYTHCEALVIPSVTEGFGLPLAEALVAGCRVICSDIPALRELGRDRCHYFSLGENEAENLASAYAAAISEPKPEPVPLPYLSAEVLAEQYVRLYRHVIENHYAKTVSEVGRNEIQNESALREI